MKETVSISFSFECPRCGAAYIPFAHDIPCPVCGHIYDCRVDFVYLCAEYIQKNLKRNQPDWIQVEPVPLQTLSDYILNSLLETLKECVVLTPYQITQSWNGIFAILTAKMEKYFIPEEISYLRGHLLLMLSELIPLLSQPGTCIWPKDIWADRYGPWDEIKFKTFLVNRYLYEQGDMLEVQIIDKDDYYPEDEPIDEHNSWVEKVQVLEVLTFPKYRVVRIEYDGYLKEYKQYWSPFVIKLINDEFTSPVYAYLSETENYSPPAHLRH